MATYKGREVTIVGDANDNTKVVIATHPEDGVDTKEMTVAKSEVTIFDPSDVPVKSDHLNNDRPLSQEEIRLQFYKRASASDIEKESERRFYKEAKDKRFIQYKTDKLTPQEIEDSERQPRQEEYKSHQDAYKYRQPVVNRNPQPVVQRPAVDNPTTVTTYPTPRPL